MKTQSPTSFSPGSALLLAVMVISILTTTTLGAIAIRFDQLASTDKITSAAKAKLAADSGLAQLRQKLTTSATFDPIVHDLTADKSIPLTGSIDQFRANPRRSVYSVESQVINLPRCLAVAVLSPWVNSGTYLLDQDDSVTNPAMIFYYANIINDTPLGIIASNTDKSGYSDTDKALPISEITKMGQFYNPYAPKGALESNRNYWTVKFGGPNDEFLYKTDPTGNGSFYKGLDFVYIPYLPRITDSGVLQVAGSAASGLTRKSGTAIRNDFEQLIKKNNLKVWLDGSTTNDWLFQFGLSDLFVDSPENRITWIQPTLWNDLPEADGEPGFASGLAGPFTANNPGATMADSKTSWTRPTLPTKQVTPNDGDWRAQIIRGSRSFSFLYPSSPTNRPLEKNGKITLSHYGSLEGLRLNQDISVVLLGAKDNRPLKLKNRDNTNQGTFYNTRITNITQEASGSVSVELSFHVSETNTPQKIDGCVGASPCPVLLSDLAVISLQAGPQLATKQSATDLTVQTDAKTISVKTPADSGCQNDATSYMVCPAVADIVSLSKTGHSPVWGRVTSVNYSSNGKKFTSFTLDKLRQYPRPLRDMASTVFMDGTTEKIAYYGGSIDANEFDGGLNTISDELWFYTPATNTWEYVANIAATGSSAPGARSGASLAFANGSLFLFGGYTYDGAGQLASGQTCADNYYLSSCLVANRAGARVAKYLPNSMFRLDLTGANARKWTKVSYDGSNGANPTTITNGNNMELRVVSRLGERSGKDGWQSRVSAGSATVDLNPANETTLTVTNSAGFGKGDQIYLTGTGSGSSSFIAWARVTEIVGATSLKIKTYGVKSSSSTAALTNVFLYSLGRIKSSTTCTWVASSFTCNAANTTSLAIGDAVTLEQYDNYGDPKSVTGSYSGYISHITGNQISFISDEKVMGLEEYKPGATYSNESVRNLPLGRIGANFFTNPGTNKIFLWQGDQVATNIAARTAETWEFDTSTSKWSLVPLSLADLPSGANALTIQSLRLPATSYVYTSTNAANNPAMVKDQEVGNEGKGGSYNVWNDSKSWTLELADEFSSIQQLTEGSTIVMERVSGTERERFTGIIDKINVGGQAKSFSVKHNPGSSGDSGLKGNSTNAKITIYYPDYRNTNALTTTCSGTVCARATKSSNDSVRVDSDENAAMLRKLPVGTTVLLYGGSLSGTNTQMFTGTIDSRSVNGTSEVVIGSAGPRFISSPVPQAYSTGALAGGGTDVDRLAIGWQNYRAKFEPGAIEWVNNLTGSTNAKKWVARFSAGYNLNSGDNRPSPRQGGAVAVSPDGHSIFIAGGGIGSFSNFWKLQDAHQFGNSKWIFGKSDYDSANDIPNLAGSSLNVLSNGNTVLFNGRRKADSTSVGPRVLTQAIDSANYDGSFSLAGQADSLLNTLKAGQFINTLSGSYASGVGSKSLRLTDMSESALNKVCRFVGEVGCDYQMMRYLGTLGRNPTFSGGSSLAVINPGSSFKKEGDARSLLLSGPAQSLTKTNDRWDQEGYYPYHCDVASKGCTLTFPFGTLDGGEANNTKTLMLAGFSRITGGGSILVTPAGIGKAIVSGAGGASYCAKEVTSVSNGNYSCNSSQSRAMRWIPDSEDVVFMLNAAKALSATDSYRVVGYYGGVLRGYLAVAVGNDLKIQEIAP